MTNSSLIDTNNFKDNIEADANEVFQQLGSSEVEFVLQKYGATSIDELAPSDYLSVFNELEFLLNN